MDNVYKTSKESKNCDKLWSMHSNKVQLQKSLKMNTRYWIHSGKNQGTLREDILNDSGWETERKMIDEKKCDPWDTFNNINISIMGVLEEERVKG